MYVKPNQKIVCSACKKPISGARTVINGMWHCSDCTYRHDYPDAVIPEPTPVRRIPKQTETIFDPGPRRKRGIEADNA